MHDKLKRRLLSALAVLFILTHAPPRSAAEPLAQAPGRLRISINDGILLLLENNLDIRIERIEPRVAEAKLKEEEGRFDLDVFGSFKRRDSTEPLSARASVAAGGRTSISSETYSFTAGISAKTSLGTYYTLETGGDWTDDTFTTSGTEYTSFTGLSITQPLLKDFGAGSNRLEINIAKKDREISAYRFTQLVIDTAVEYELLYWDLVLARKELDVKKESLALAETLLEQNRLRQRAGTMSALEVIQAEAAVAARKDEIIKAGKAVRDKENPLKLLLSKDVYELKDLEIVPTETPRVNPVEANHMESVKTAFGARQDYLEIKKEIEKNNFRILYAKKQKLPQVDVEASYGYNGIGSTFGNSFTGIEANPKWSLGVVMRYPLGNNGALGELRAARLKAGQELLRLKRLEQQIIISIDASIKDLRADRERIKTAITSTRLAEKVMRAEGKKLAAGGSTTFNVLKLQEDLIKAKSNEIGALIDYNKAMVRYSRARGTLLEDLGIKVAEVAGPLTSDPAPGI